MIATGHYVNCDVNMYPHNIFGIAQKQMMLDPFEKLIQSYHKLFKQNFQLHFFYGESANAIKIQIWVTIIANLLLTIIQRSLHRRWSFPNLATMVRIHVLHGLPKLLREPR